MCVANHFPLARWAAGVQTGRSSTGILVATIPPAQQTQPNKGIEQESRSALGPPEPPRHTPRSTRFFKQIKDRRIGSGEEDLRVDLRLG